MKGDRIELAQYNDCSGCMACGDACPKQCISFIMKDDGFWYPQIDYNNCIGCHTCEHTCPVLSRKKTSESPPNAYAAWANKEVRKNSASGGAFYAMAVEIINRGGYVSGAVFDGKYVKHILTNSIDDLKAIQGTKYFQSRTTGVFKQIKQLLKEGKVVLFGGTSCQVAGLLKVVGEENDNLITVDLICYGVPSTLTIDAEERMRGKKLRRIITNRDKNHDGGWRNCYYMTCEWDDGTITVSSPGDSFMLAAFNGGMTMRKSCYHCFYKTISRQADITIGDYHNVKDFEEEKDNGISLVLTHTERGKSFLRLIQGLEIHERPLLESLNGKRTIYYNDSIYERHPLRIIMPWALRNAPIWFVNIAYRGFIKTMNPFVWPFSIIGLVYREINQYKANIAFKNIKYNENRCTNIP